MSSGQQPTAEAAADGASAAPRTGQDVIRLHDVTKVYGRRRGLLARDREGIVAVDGVNLTVKRGRTLGIVGETGSGKSTVAQLVMGMVRPTAGSVVVAGHDLSQGGGQERMRLQRLRQVVLQDPYSSLDPRMKVRDIIAEPLTLGRRLSKSRRAEVNARVLELLDLVGLPASRVDFYPHQFSGGQRQRISIARALAPEPELIVLDEPTSALDVSVRAQILNLLKRLQEELGVTYLVISHDLLTVSYLASTVAVMHRGRIVELGPTQSLYREPRHPYTFKLLASIPASSGNFLDLRAPVVAEPRDSLPASACHYASRCELRALLDGPAACVEKDPALSSPQEDGHAAACHFPDWVGSLSSDQSGPPESLPAAGS